MDRPDDDSADRAEGGERFELVRRIGVGGMGVVYEAYDRERDARVALKTLRRLSPTSLFRFKQEFRALADVAHPNLVTLYELLSVEGRWLFTMELLDGVDVLSYLRGAPPATACASDAARPGTLAETLTQGVITDGQPALDETSPTMTSSRSPATRRPPAHPAAPGRIREVLPQLVGALVALHRAGVLHRDVKPSNVMVTREGRVVVLDFGVVANLASGADDGNAFVGTPAYAAPEQARADAALSAASDWYSVGAILYEALTGRRPFVGTAEQILTAKQERDPPPPHELAPDVDRELEQLCVCMLARDPAARPSDRELEQLTRRSSVATSPAPRPPPADASRIVGRERELAALAAAFDDALRGTGTSVHIHGPSGMGKTALAEHFLRDVATDPRVLILAGRCYERESVPYQAIDSLVDALCRFLLELNRGVADALLPVDVAALARAFPVLRRIEAIAEARRRPGPVAHDPVELRRQAFAALRELLARIAAQRPLVVFIDDLHWGDADSAPFLVDLMRPPAPPLLFVTGYRTEQLASSAAVRALRGDSGDGGGEHAPYRELRLARLSVEHAHELARALLRAAGAPIEAAAHIAREAAGNPFLVHEFVRFAASEPTAGAAGDPAPPRSFDLATVIAARTAALSDPARAALTAIAVAGRPITQGAIRRATELGDEFPRALADLRAAHLVRTHGGRDRDLVETYHDRIRDAVVAALPPADVRRAHLRIARGVEGDPHPDPEALALHFAAAGEPDTALEYASAAADAAAEALAFDRAAAMYRLASELLPAADRAARAAVGRDLGDALSNAGRGVDAARAYLTAAELAEPSARLELTTLGGAALLRCGRVDEGLDVLRPALAAAGVHIARTPRRAMLSIAYGRLRVRLRGLGFRPRAPSELAPRDAARIDAFAAAAGVLGMADNLRGADVQTRHLLAALRAGDPTRVGRAIVYEIAFRSLAGPKGWRRTRVALDALNQIVRETGDPLLEALHAAMSALASYQQGRWSACRADAERAVATMRARCRGAAWEMASAQLYLLWALCWLGELAELDRQRDEFVRAARARGDRYAEVSLSTGVPNVATLAADRPDTVRRRVERTSALWTTGGYHLQHYWAQLSLAHCDLYEGDPRAAYRRLEDNAAPMKRAFYDKISIVRAEVRQLRSAAALAAAESGDDRDRFRRLARREIKRFSRVRLAWCVPASQLLRAGLAALDGARERALGLLDEAERGFHEAHMAAYAAVCRRRIGQLTGGERGADMARDADDRLAALGVRAPARFANLLAPGFAAYRE